jgi:hypothetical protein
LLPASRIASAREWLSDAQSPARRIAQAFADAFFALGMGFKGALRPPPAAS